MNRVRHMLVPMCKCGGVSIRRVPEMRDGTPVYLCYYAHPLSRYLMNHGQAGTTGGHEVWVAMSPFGTAAPCAILWLRDIEDHRIYKHESFLLYKRLSETWIVHRLLYSFHLSCVRAPYQIYKTHLSTHEESYSEWRLVEIMFAPSSLHISSKLSPRAAITAMKSANQLVTV